MVNPNKSTVDGGAAGQEDDEFGAEEVDPMMQGVDSNISGFGDDDPSVGGPLSGKNRFDNLLKSLIARIEFNNTLAPI